MALSFGAKTRSQQLKLALIPLLVVTMVAVWWQGNAAPVPTAGKKRPLPVVKTSDTSQLDGRSTPLSQKFVIDASLAKAFNPFAKIQPADATSPQPKAAPALPHQTSEDETVALKVDAIVQQGGKFQALVDGRVVEVGDVVGDRQVLRITRNGVVVTDSSFPTGNPSAESGELP